MAVRVRAGRRPACDEEAHRREAVAAVRAALASPATAAELEARLHAAHGVSPRQARRWVAWAVAGPEAPVTRSPKGTDGTTYALPARPEPAPPRWTLSVGAEGVAGLDPVARRDVALTVLALRGLGGKSNGDLLVHAVGGLAGRCLAWARGAVFDAVALCTALRGPRMATPDASTTYDLAAGAAGLDDGQLRQWASEPRFSLPPGDLTEAAVAVLGEGEEMAPDRNIVLVPHLARLGGCAAWEELPEGGRGALSRLRRPESLPAPTEWLPLARVALAPGLATTWLACEATQG